MSFENRTILITGGLGGIGGAVASHFLERGATVVVTDRREDDGGAVSALGERAHYARLDVTSESGWAQVVGDLVDRHGKLDALVNIAGVFTPGIPFEAMTLAQWRFHMDVNLDGSFLGCRTAMSAMSSTGGGAIVNFSSGPRAYHAQRWRRLLRFESGGAGADPPGGEGRRQIRRAGECGAARRHRYADVVGQSAGRARSAGAGRHACQAASDRPDRPDRRCRESRGISLRPPRTVLSPVPCWQWMAANLWIEAPTGLPRRVLQTNAATICPVASKEVWYG